MSNRKQRSRSADTASGSKQQPHHGSEEQLTPSRHAPHPPQRNVTMLSVSIVLFVAWLSFLAYVALFG
ncbi:MAG: hypothetical protein HYV60_04410 [Planctomycetia bacterium]|nr:hypothetical protein [Planctomycetia bacterium]